MRPNYIKHPDMLALVYAHLSAVLELGTYAMVAMHITHKVYLYRPMKQ